jgi:hypothetical protein
MQSCFVKAQGTIGNYPERQEYPFCRELLASIESCVVFAPDYVDNPVTHIYKPSSLP